MRRYIAEPFDAGGFVGRVRFEVGDHRERGNFTEQGLRHEQSEGESIPRLSPAPAPLCRQGPFPDPEEN